MKIRASVVSFISSHPPEHEKKTKTKTKTEDNGFSASDASVRKNQRISVRNQYIRKTSFFNKWERRGVEIPEVVYITHHTHPVIRAIGVSHTACKDEFDKIFDLGPVTMKSQKFEIPEDPSQTLPELSPMDPTWWNYFLKLSRIPEKKQFLAAILANIGLRILKQILD